MDIRENQHELSQHVWVTMVIPYLQAYKDYDEAYNHGSEEHTIAYLADAEMYRSNLYSWLASASSSLADRAHKVIGTGSPLPLEDWLVQIVAEGAAVVHNEYLDAAKYRDKALDLLEKTSNVMLEDKISQ